MKTIRGLDLFCCGGGASVGYSKAGICMTGLDIAPQPEYPFEYFLQADAVEFLKEAGDQLPFDFIHASPPCQAYSKHVTSKSSKHAMTRGKDEPMLIGVIRELLEKTGKPYVIENVMGAMDHMNPNLMLCGSMFGLPIPRHRIFECRGFTVQQPAHPKCIGIAKRFAEERGWEYRDMSVTGKGRRAGTTERWKEIMGVDWNVTQRQLAEMIPPAYTKYIGRAIMDAEKHNYIHSCVMGGDPPEVAEAEWHGMECES